MKPPGVLKHCPLESHGLVRHSLTSVQEIPSPSKPSGHEHVNPSFEPMHESGRTQRWLFSAQKSMATRVPLTRRKPLRMVQRPSTRCAAQVLVGSHWVQSW